MTLMKQLEEIVELAHRRGLRLPAMNIPVRGGISSQCNSGHHFDCSGCSCQCHGGSPGWAR